MLFFFTEKRPCWPASGSNACVHHHLVPHTVHELYPFSLRQMMSDGLAYRHDYHEQPPRVEYGLTELGTKMLPIVNSLADFGNYYKSIIEQN